MTDPSIFDPAYTPAIYSPALVHWEQAENRIGYKKAVDAMERHVTNIADGIAPERVWLLEHPPLYSAGTRANKSDLIDPNRFDVFESGRGGQFTYHGPGQRVAYVMLDLRTRGRDVSAFVRALEQWIINTLAEFDVSAERRCGRVGVWVVTPEGREKKIAAIGIRLRKWVSFHGISINLNPNLEHFSGIIPCGIQEHGVTSFQDLGVAANMNALDLALQKNFIKIFGPIDRN